MRLVLIGPPGVGKGTQLAGLALRYDVKRLSTGDILREEMSLKTPLGMAIAERVNSGSLVTDETVIAIVRNRILAEEHKNGFVFDGFPRTIAQAEALENMLAENGLPLDRVISIEAPDDALVERMSYRLTCKLCKNTFHALYYPPKNKGFCDACEGELMIREDDKPETFKNRLKVYHEQTEPIISFYKQRGMLLTVSGLGDAKEITQKIIDCIEGILV